jgi:hypothetical protein
MSRLFDMKSEPSNSPAMPQDEVFQAPIRAFRLVFGEFNFNATEAEAQKMLEKLRSKVGDIVKLEKV